MVMAPGETSREKSPLNFRAAIGVSSPNQKTRMFDNSLFSNDARDGGFVPIGGSRIPKVNGCLECSKERPVLVIQP